MLPRDALWRIQRRRECPGVGRRLSKVEDFVERESLQNFLEIAIEGGELARVEDGVVGEVWRSFGLVGSDEGDEFVFDMGCSA